MAATLTVTGVTGPAQAVTAAVYANVTTFTVATESNMLFFVQASVNREIAITSAATITATKSGTTWTLVIS